MVQHPCLRRLAFVAGTVLGLSGAAQAAPVLRDATVVVLCAERHGAVDQARCSADADLDALLRAEGARVVDPAQAEQIRKTLDPRALTSADGLKGVDMADADVIVSVTIDVEEIGRVGSVTRHDGRAAVRLIDVPRAFVGPVVAVNDVWQGTPGQVARAVSRELFIKNRDRVVAAFEAARVEARGVDVWVFDVPGQPELDIVDGALRGLGLEAFKAVSFMKGVAKRRIQPKADLDAEAVGRIMGSGDAPVVVGGVSGGLLQLVWSPAARVRVGALVQSTATAAPGWLQAAQADLVASALSTTGWVLPRQLETEPHDVILKVETTAAGKQGHRVAATLLRRGTGKRLAAGVAVAKEDRLAATLESVVQKTVNDFRAYLAAHPTELSVWQRLKDAPEALAVTLTPTFARDGLVRPADLAGDVVARVAVSPRPDALRARVRLGELTPYARWSSDGSVALVDDAGASLLSPSLVTTPTPTRLEIEVEARIGERLSRQTVAVALVVHPDRTIDREEPATLSRLLEPGAAFAREWGREALAAPPTTVLSPAFTRAIAVLGAAGGRLQLRPLAEPLSGRFASVPSPTQVVAAGGGPAEALLGVATSLLWEQGVDLRVVRAGPELLVAFDAGLPVSAWELVAPRRDEVIDVDGRLFVPFHPAALGGGDVFAGLRSGGAAVARAGRALALVAPPATTTTTIATSTPASTSSPVAAPAKATERVRVLVWDLEGQGDAAPLAGAATEALARSLSQVAGLNVLSRKDLTDILAVEATRQAVGCDDASCFVELAAAVGARYVVAGRTTRLKGMTRADVVLLDTGSLESLERIGVELVADDVVPGALARTAWRLALPILGRSAQPTPVEVAALAHVDGLLSATREARRRVRLLAVGGDVAAARRVAASLPAAPRALALAHLDLLDGRVAEARAAYARLGGAAELSAWLAAAIAGDGAALATIEPRLARLPAIEVALARRFIAARASGPLTTTERSALAALLPWP
jgi:TolB-like protein